MLKIHARLFIAGFMITAILIGAVCGFAVVDMTTDRYMPGQFAPMLEISSLNSEELAFSFMGQAYRVAAEPLKHFSQATQPWRGLLPAHMRMGQLAALRLHEAAEQALWDYRYGT